MFSCLLACPPPGCELQSSSAFLNTRCEAWPRLASISLKSFEKRGWPITALWHFWISLFRLLLRFAHLFLFLKRIFFFIRMQYSHILFWTDSRDNTQAGTYSRAGGNRCDRQELLIAVAKRCFPTIHLPPRPPQTFDVSRLCDESKRDSCRRGGSICRLL